MAEEPEFSILKLLNALIIVISIMATLGIFIFCAIKSR